MEKQETCPYMHHTHSLEVGASAHTHCTRQAGLEDDLMEVLAKHNVPLSAVKERLNSFAEHLKDDSSAYLNHPGWNNHRAIGAFERIYGVRPFGPCSVGIAGVTVIDSEGKEIPHKKIVIGHLGAQELTLDVLDTERRDCKRKE